MTVNVIIRRGEGEMDILIVSDRLIHYYVIMLLRYYVITLLRYYIIAKINNHYYLHY